MKKLFSLLALIGFISMMGTGTASAKCYAWKKVCHPIYKKVAYYATCYDDYDEPYQCQKHKKVKVSSNCKSVCKSWSAPKTYYKKKIYKKKFYKKKSYGNY